MNRDPKIRELCSRGTDYAYCWSAINGNLDNIRYLVEECGAKKQEELDEALCFSASGGFLHIIQYLADAGANIRSKEDRPLRWSATNGHLEVVKYLIERGAYCETALGLTASNGHLPVVQYLVEKGADIHTDNDYALRWSATNGHLPVVQYLIEKGADIHAENDYALRWSVRYENWELVHFLIDQGANSAVLDTPPPPRGQQTFGWKPAPNHIHFFRDCVECPISRVEFTEDTVLVGCGRCLNLFEKCALEEWLRRQTVCPMCRAMGDFYLC